MFSNKRKAENSNYTSTSNKRPRLKEGCIKEYETEDETNVLPLSKSQKRNLRRKDKVLSAPRTSEHGAAKIYDTNKHGYKFNTCIVRKPGLYKNFTKENMFGSLFSKSICVQDKIRNVCDKIINTKVGVEFEDSNKILKSQEFSNVLENFIRKLNKIPVMSLLDVHCPAKAPDYTPGTQIYAFVRAVFHKSQIYSLLAYKSRKKLDRCVRRYLHSPRNMQIPLGMYVQAFKKDDIAWFTNNNNVNISNNIAAKIIHWILTDFCEPLIRSCFKMTDISQRNCKKKIFYYRKSVWKKLLDHGLEKLVENNYVEISADDCAKLMKASSKPIISELRFLPKSNKYDVRPITRRQRSSNSEHTEIIKALQLIADRFPAKSDLSGKTLHIKWTEFIKSVDKEENIYCVVADINDAFGSIRLSRLKAILEKYYSCTEQSSQTLLKSVLSRLYLQVVRFHQDDKIRRFLVKQGVLQGDPLSCLLSDIYYGYLTKQHLQQFTTKSKEVLLRGADDFLFLTTSLEQAKRFIKMISDGFASYNCHFNKQKTQTNVNNENISTFTYCGSIIDLKSRSISPNMDSYMNANIGYAQSWPLLGRPTGAWIFRKFNKLCSLKLSCLYFNDTNDKNTCMQTLSSNVFIGLRRLTVMLDVLIRSRHRKVQEKWIWNCIMDGLSKFLSVCNLCQLTQVEVKYICMKSLISECRSPVYPNSVVQGAKSYLNKCKLSPSLAQHIDCILLQVPRRIPNVSATANWK